MGGGRGWGRGREKGEEGKREQRGGGQEEEGGGRKRLGRGGREGERVGPSLFIYTFILRDSKRSYARGSGIGSGSYDETE